RALAEESQKLAAYEFRDPQVLSDTELLEVYNTLPIFLEWASAINKYFLEQALNGKEWKGYKVVEGRSNRKWLDDQKVKERLIELKYPEDKFLVTKLAGITAVEKLVGKSKFGDLLNDLIAKPPGAPTLVHE